MNRPATLDRKERDHFATVGTNWDKGGPFDALHKLNPERLSYLLEATRQNFKKDGLEGLTLLDVGCGGGIFAQSLARAGATVTGIDVSTQVLTAAKASAKKAKLKIDYQLSTIEDAKGKYDIITASEVIEHVANPALFIKECAKRLKPKGLLFLTTISRTPKSFALAIVGAEYILNLAPKGTHDWKKFLKPSELAELVTQNGLEIGGATGLIYNPITQRFTRNAERMAVNYMLWAKK